MIRHNDVIPAAHARETRSQRVAREDLTEKYVRHVRNMLLILTLGTWFLAGAALVGARDLGVLAQPPTVLEVPPSYCVTMGPGTPGCPRSS